MATYSARNLQLKLGLPLWSQLVGWACLGPCSRVKPADIVAIASSLPFVVLRGIRSHELRIALLAGALAPCFVLLSISFETLFLLSYSVMVLTWLDVEAPRSQPRASRALCREDVWRALVVLLFIHIGFFGTGNVASISSFYLEPVYRLVPVFNPFLMSALLLYKILIPFAIASAVLAALHHRLGLPTFSLYLLALGLGDVLTITFFWTVRDQGSWLEIGQVCQQSSMRPTDIGRRSRTSRSPAY